MFQDLTTVRIVHTVDGFEAFIAFAWLITLLWITGTLFFVARAILVTTSIEVNGVLILCWSTFNGSWWAGADLWATHFIICALLDVPVAPPSSLWATISSPLKHFPTLWKFSVTAWSFWKSLTFGGIWGFAVSLGLDFAVDELLLTLTSLTLGSWVLPVVLVDFVDGGTFDTSISNLDDVALARPLIATTVIDQFGLALLAWVVSWTGTSWGIAELTTLWHWWAGTLVLVAAWVLWVWPLDLFHVTLGTVALKFVHESRANIALASVAALLWLTRVRVVASTLGLTKNLSGAVAGWWTWAIDDLAVDGTDAVILHTVENGTVVLPWFATWLIGVTKMLTLAIVGVLTVVGWAAVAGFGWLGVDDGIGSTAEVDGQWLLWASWTDTLLLHAHARVGDGGIDSFAFIGLSSLVEIASMIVGGGNHVSIANQFGVAWQA